jgi:hypothetical protein
MIDLVAKTRAHLKAEGSAGSSQLLAFNQKLAEANQCKNEYPGHPDLIASCKARTVNEALWAAGVHRSPVINSTCDGRKGATAERPENWAGNIFVNRPKGGRMAKSKKTKRASKNMRKSKKSNSRKY